MRANHISIVPGRFLTGLAALCLLLAFTGTAMGQARKPLLIPGKTTLYERVLTRPGASVAQGVGAPGETPLDPFTPLYVYQRYPVDGGGKTYLEVGSDQHGKVIGFLDEADTVPWRHALTLAFTERVGRERTLFLDTSDALKQWIAAPSLKADAAAARQAIDAKALPPESPVISIEPQEYVDFEDNFYLLPVLDVESVRMPNRRRGNIVEVASVTRKPGAPPKKRRINPADLADFRAGVVFVIDASSSMGPYIDRTRAVMRRVLERVEAEGLADKVRFGLVAYRDDPGAVRGVEFLTRTFADPNIIESADAFANAVGPLDASKVSTRAFAEDAFSAVDAAFRTINWSDFGARNIILVTDASARTALAETVNGKTVPPSSTALSLSGMKQIVDANKTALFALHLKSPVGVDDHARAAAQYRELSRFAGVQPLYYPVEAGDPNLFAKTVEELANALVGQVQGAYQAVLDKAPKPEAATSGGVAEGALIVGRAMALAHLGRTNGVQAPTMFRSWASEKDFDDPNVSNFSVRVLLTRNQLSDLQQTMAIAVQGLEAGQIEPDDLFNRLRSAALAAGRDPSKTGQGGARDMQATGLVNEFLDGLPYQSRLMSLTEAQWIAMGIGDQQTIIDEAYANIRLYQRYHDDPERWIALNEGADPGDHVYPIPLSALP